MTLTVRRVKELATKVVIIWTDVVVFCVHCKVVISGCLLPKTNSDW